jgi:hypothetical protein
MWGGAAFEETAKTLASIPRLSCPVMGSRIRKPPRADDGHPRRLPRRSNTVQFVLTLPDDVYYGMVITVLIVMNVGLGCGLTLTCSSSEDRHLYQSDVGKATYRCAIC